ncbi:MAG: GNAT family N-acetyltransferase, partial [Patescibacteria group bacterium]
MATEVQARTADRRYQPIKLGEAQLANIRIRRPLWTELEAVIDLRTELFTPYTRRRISRQERRRDVDPNTVHSAAFEGAQIIDTGLICPDPEDLEAMSMFNVYAVGVHPKYRRQGIGAKVVSYLEERAISLGATDIYLSANNTAIGFYEK